jgi:hypothetical protein
LLPGGSGYFTCKKKMKLVTTEFKSGGLREKHVVATWESWEPSKRLLIDTGKPRNVAVPSKDGAVYGKAALSELYFSF